MNAAPIRHTFAIAPLIPLVVLLTLVLGACSTPAGGGGGDDEPDATEVTEEVSPPEDEGPPPDDGPDGPTQELQWTVDPNVPAAVQGKSMRHFSGYSDGGLDKLYFCGEGGVFRVREGENWQDRDLNTSDTINSCHAVADNLMAAVGDVGQVWKQTGTGNWQSNDLIATPQNLRGVWITSLAVLHVVGEQGSVFRLDNTTWTDESLEGIDGALNAIYGLDDGTMFAVGKDALLSFDGTVWTQEVIPEDPPGTVEANKGFTGRAVWAADAANAWAVGDNGKIAYRDGAGTWTYQDSQWFGGTPFNMVWGLSATDVIVAGTVGIARRWNGTEWTIMEVKTPKKTPLQDLWPPDRKVPPEPQLDYIGAHGLDASHLWLFDRGGLLIRYNDEYQL